MYLLVECIEREITAPWQHDTLEAVQEHMCSLFAEAAHMPEDEVLNKLRNVKEPRSLGTPQKGAKTKPRKVGNFRGKPKDANGG